MEFLSRRDILTWGLAPHKFSSKCTSPVANKHVRYSSRREALLSGALLGLLATVPTSATKPVAAISSIVGDETATMSFIGGVTDSLLRNFQYNANWTGTSLPLLTVGEAAYYPEPYYPMGRWPDPILRRPSTSFPKDAIKKDPLLLTNISNKLRQTARENGAVGLAAQQCGIDVSMIFLDEPGLLGGGVRVGGGSFFINPRIFHRSPEEDMKVWKERCLVLPPSFTATVLRDATVEVQYENLQGETKCRTLKGELARAFQHELDHDRGILIVDHVSFDELEAESVVMRKIEEKGHEERQSLAYQRFLG